MYARRNLIIRSVASIAGDAAIGLATASACLWIIQAASLGLFLSFLLWLVAAILSLVASQYLLRPAVRWLLSDQKLDDTITAAGALADVGVEVGRQVFSGLAQHLAPSLNALTGRFRAG